MGTPSAVDIFARIIAVLALVIGGYLLWVRISERSGDDDPKAGGDDSASGDAAITVVCRFGGSSAFSRVALGQASSVSGA